MEEQKHAKILHYKSEKTSEVKWLSMPSEITYYHSLNNKSQNSTVAYQKAYAVLDIWCCKQLFRKEVTGFSLEIWEKFIRFKTQEKEILETICSYHKDFTA